ncbi:MAG: BBE domain-containing protein [Acidimicrobiia bacterium]
MVEVKFEYDPDNWFQFEQSLGRGARDRKS